MRTSHTVGVHAARVEQRRGLLGRLDHLPDREDADVATRPRPCAPSGRGPPRRAPTWRAGVFGQRSATGPEVDAQRLVSITPTSSYDDGANTVMPGDLGEQREVVETVVAGAVVAGDAGAVDAEDHREPVQADVVDELVPRTVQERGVDRDDGAQPAHRHARGGGDRVLLGDADVEATVGEALGEVEQPGGARHARGDRHDLRVLVAELDERVGERAGVRRRAALAVRHAGLGIERADVVEALLVVGLGRARSPRPSA